MGTDESSEDSARRRASITIRVRVRVTVRVKIRVRVRNRVRVRPLVRKGATELSEWPSCSTRVAKYTSPLLVRLVS